MRLPRLNSENYRISRQCREFEFLEAFKNQGLARKIGFSHHSSAALPEKILTAHPEVEIVQLQINYLDIFDPGIQAGARYEIAEALE